jgi:cell division protease FtsH
MDTQPPTSSPTPPARPRLASSTIWLLIILLVIMVFAWYQQDRTTRTKISYDFFYRQLQANNVAEIEFINPQQIVGRFSDLEFARRQLDRHAQLKPTPQVPPADGQASDAAGSANDAVKGDENPIERAKKTPAAKNEKRKKTATTPDDPKSEDLLEHFSVNVQPAVGDGFEQLLNAQIERGLVVKSFEPEDNTMLILLVYVLVPALLFFGLWVMIRRTRDQVMGGGILSGFAKSPAKRYETSKKPITFADVAGLEGVKNDLQEIVEFLKNPEKFTRLGGRVPKGVLLMGPPGTGKTLLARAVAGEAGVPFFSISGSEFIQMFVGVGASRVRDMFKTAKDASPSILFIDEIDAVGRHRGAGLGGGHDEREQTLNQILSEMDGFSPNESVIVLAATNRPDVLDPALLRPGRFDRHVTVDRPNHRGRVAIFKVHVRDVPLAKDVDLDKLAAGTVGLTGADIRNLVNEAALWATRNGKDKVDMDDFEYARDKVLMGPKRDEVLMGKEKAMTAYHEAGHALLAWLLPGIDRLHKVTIIPRGRALGVTQLLPEEDRLNIGETDLKNRLVFMLGGRAAEKLVYNEYSAGAENDLTQCTKLARRMVAHWGMSDRLGPVAYRHSEEHPFLGREIVEQREFSDFTARLIDEEIARILGSAQDRAARMLAEHRSELDAIAAALEEKEVLDEFELEQLIGPPAHRQPSLNGKPSEGSAAVDDKVDGVPAKAPVGASPQEQ